MSVHFVSVIQCDAACAHLCVSQQCILSVHLHLWLNVTLHAYVCLWQLDQPSVLEMSEVGDSATKMSFGLVQMEADLDFSLEIATG